MTVAALEELVAIPSVSGDPARRDDVGRAAAWLAARLGSLGGRVVPTGGHPLVLGEWLGAEGAPTVLIYAHYDVQPAGEEGAWQTPPFEPAVRGERMYGRGTSDDKGPMLAALGAVERLLEERGRLPVNVRILLEGEEEIGSPNLEAALAANREMLRADVAVSADGAMWSAEQPSLNVAARGMLAVDVSVRGPAADLHSGRHGGAVQNPLRALAEIVASLHRADGTVAVDGFSDEVVDLTDADREEIGEMPFDDDAYRDEVGAPELHGESGYTPLERLTARPTLEVSQIEGGGRYTVIPAVARAYLTCRLVPDQDPARVAAAIARHVIKHCPPGVTVSVEEVPGGIPAYAIRRDHPALAAAEEALRSVYPGRRVLRTRAGGTLPAAVLLRRALGLDTLLFSFSSSDECFHGPNEFFRLSRLREGTDAWARLLDLLAKGSKRTRLRGRGSSSCHRCRATSASATAPSTAISRWPSPNAQLTSEITPNSVSSASRRLRRFTWRSRRSGLNPLRHGREHGRRQEALEGEPEAERQLPENSGIVAMLCSVPPGWSTSNITAIPERQINGPPTSPSMAMRRGTSSDWYIR